MALTALEQLKLVSGEVKPEATDLRTLVKASAFIYAANFQFGSKVFDESSELDATSYKSKMYALVRRIISGNADESIFRVIVTIIGQAATDLVQVQNATDAQWEVFVSDQIDEAMEIVADIRLNEKTAYDAL